MDATPFTNHDQVEAALKAASEWLHEMAATYEDNEPEWVSLALEDQILFGLDELRHYIDHPEKAEGRVSWTPWPAPSP